MTLGKKEVKLLIVLGLVVYAFLFYMIFVNNYIPEINEVNAKLSEAQAKEKALKDDLANIEQKKSDLNSKDIIGERMGNYLLEKGDVTDCIEYMEKLDRLIGKKLKDASISAPKEITLTGTTSNNNSSSNSSDENLMANSDTNQTSSGSVNSKYYEMSIDFKADLAYNEIWELLNYIEGASRKVHVTRFSLRPNKEAAGSGGVQNSAAKPTPVPTPVPGQQNGTVPIGPKYQVDMTINIYAQDLSEADKVYNFNRNKFNNFNESSGINFTIAQAYTSPNNPIIGNTQQGSQITVAQQTTSVTDVDFAIEENGFLTAGDNLVIRGINGENGVFSYKTGGRTDVSLSLDGSKYKIVINYAIGKSKTLSGRLPNRDLNMVVGAFIPDIEVNNKIKLNVKITNNTKKKLNIKLNDSLGRVKVTDRSGNVIKGSNDKEKVSIS
jgi:hypothetical protein